jgi:hypothetical protein
MATMAEDRVRAEERDARKAKLDGMLVSVGQADKVLAKKKADYDGVVALLSRVRRDAEQIPETINVVSMGNVRILILQALDDALVDQRRHIADIREEQRKAVALRTNVERSLALEFPQEAQ